MSGAVGRGRRAAEHFLASAGWQRGMASIGTPAEELGMSSLRPPDQRPATSGYGLVSPPNNLLSSWQAKEEDVPIRRGDT